MKKITLKDKETAEELAPRTTVEQVDGLSSILGAKADEATVNQYITEHAAEYTALNTKINNFLDVNDESTDQLSELITLLNTKKGSQEIATELEQYAKKSEIPDTSSFLTTSGGTLTGDLTAPNITISGNLTDGTNTLTVADIYKVKNLPSVITANPNSDPVEALTKIKIGDITYSVSGGGGSGSSPYILKDGIITTENSATITLKNFPTGLIPVGSYINSIMPITIGSDSLSEYNRYYHYYNNVNINIGGDRTQSDNSISLLASDNTYLNFNNKLYNIYCTDNKEIIKDTGTDSIVNAYIISTGSSSKGINLNSNNCIINTYIDSSNWTDWYFNQGRLTSNIINGSVRLDNKNSTLQNSIINGRILSSVAGIDIANILSNCNNLKIGSGSGLDFTKRMSAFGLDLLIDTPIDGKVIIGRGNIDGDDTAILEVGCGTSSNRANCFTTGNDGTEDYIKIGDTKITETQLQQLLALLSQQ